MSFQFQHIVIVIVLFNASIAKNETAAYLNL